METDLGWILAAIAGGSGALGVAVRKWVMPLLRTAAAASPPADHDGCHAMIEQRDARIAEMHKIMVDYHYRTADSTTLWCPVSGCVLAAHADATHVGSDGHQFTYTAID